MKKPQNAPGIPDLLAEMTNPDRLQAILTAVPGSTLGGKYLHWDKLRYYQPPGDLSHREWWLAIKLQRNNLSREIPLTDRGGAPFRYVSTEAASEHLHLIDLGVGGHIEMPDQITNPDEKDRYYVGSLIEEAITSSQLEGATTTRQVAKDMIRAGRPPRDRSEQMILNNFQTMKRIGKLKDHALTKELVFEIHRLMTHDTLDDPSCAGRFRRDDRPGERIVVGDAYGEVYHEPPASDHLETRLSAMCDYANGRIPNGFVHPALRSIILHFWLAYDHPFVDGNGRTARALFYWSMLRYKFWLFEFVSISQILLKAPVKYSRAFLYTETDGNDLTYFVLYHLDVIRRAIAELHAYIRRKSKQLKMVEAELRGIAVLNHRQRALISHAIRHPQHRYTIKSHQTSHQVAYETARKDLRGLEERRLLIPVKVGKVGYFSSVENLPKAVAGLA